VGGLVLDPRTGSLAPPTYINYGTGMRRFTFFCDEEGITPLQAAAADMLRFTSWLVRVGSVAASSLQPNFSTINKLFLDHLREPMELGPLLTDARRGLAMMRQPIADPDIRIPIPVLVVQQMLQFARQHYRAITWSMHNLIHIKTFRAILAVCNNSYSFCRCHMDDIAVYTTGGNILLFVRKAKGNQRRSAADKPLYMSRLQRCCY
jgi:hypothetical protein